LWPGTAKLAVWATAFALAVLAAYASASRAEAFTGPYLPSTYDSGLDEWTVNDCSSLLQGQAFSFTKFWNLVSAGSSNTGGNCSSFQPLPLSFFAAEYAAAGSPGFPFVWSIEFFDSTGGMGTSLGYSQVVYNGSTIVPDDPSADTTQRIISVLPESGTTEPDNSVYVQVEVFNQTSDRVRLSFQNFDFLGTIPSVTLTLPFVSGQVSTSITLSLADGYYMMTTQMLEPDGTLVDSRVNLFTVVQSSSGGLSYDPSIASTTVPTCVGTSTSALFYPIINFGCYLVVPSPASVAQFSSLTALLRQTAPFSYFYDVRSIVASSSLNAASSTLGTYTLVIGSSTDPFHVEQVMFSPQTIRYFVPDSLASVFRTLMTASLSVGMLWYFYRRITVLLSNSNK